MGKRGLDVSFSVFGSRCGGCCFRYDVLYLGGDIVRLRVLLQSFSTDKY